MNSMQNSQEPVGCMSKQRSLESPLGLLLPISRAFHVVPVHMVPGTTGIGSDQNRAWNARRPNSPRLGPSLTAAVKEGPLDLSME